MQEPKKSGVEPVVLQIHVSGRWMPFLSAVTVFALLPALSGSAPAEQITPQPLGARPQKQEGDLAAAVAARLGSGSTLADATGVGVPLGIGGGAIDFPGIQLALTTAQATAAAAAGVGLPASPFVKRPGFIWPVIGRVMSEFGPRRHPVLGIPMFHTGIDLSSACGTPIRAAADGTVDYAGVTPSWGNRVILQHDPELKTGYAHMSKLLVRRGDVVRQGQVIGLVGTTGWSTGCHLHFDVIVNDRYVDPRPYLGLPGARSATVPYRAAPHNVLDGRGTVLYTVEDGDVPISSATVPSTSPSTSYPTTSTTTSPTGSPTTSTSSPTTTTSDPTTTTSDPTTTSSPTTTTSDPTTTSSPTTTTSDPTTTSSPTSTTTTSEPAAPSDTTTSSAPSTTSDTSGSTTTSASTSSDPTTTTP